MKTVGFVDYYINEWHANNYVGWIRNAAEKLGEHSLMASDIIDNLPYAIKGE